MLRFSLRLAPMKMCRGSISVNAVERNLFLLEYNKQTSEFHHFISYPRAGTWSNGAANLTQTWVSALMSNQFSNDAKSGSCELCLTPLLRTFPSASLGAPSCNLKLVVCVS